MGGLSLADFFTFLDLRLTTWVTGVECVSETVLFLWLSRGALCGNSGKLVAAMSRRHNKSSVGNAHHIILL